VICSAIGQRGNIPVVVGGTGLYLRALLDGIFEGPPKFAEVRRRLRKVAERKGKQFLHRYLEREDPESAARIPPKDLIRIIRALEVKLATGQTISALRKSVKPLVGFSILKIALDLPRSELYDRINLRVLKMFADGLLDEVSDLLALGYSANAKGFEALGYRYSISVLLGKLSEEDAIEFTQRDTRRYAKRQMTWFRKEREMRWIEGPGESSAALESVFQLLGNS
jgi:tRNA dimethylallyltransferase